LNVFSAAALGKSVSVNQIYAAFPAQRYATPVMEKVQIQKLHTLTGHRDCVYTIEPSTLPGVFFSAAGDGMVVKWDLQQPDQGERIAQLPNSIYAIHHHSLSNLLVVGHNYEGIHLLDWEHKKEVGSLKLSSAAIFDIQSYGNDLFIASGDGTVTVVDLHQRAIREQLSFSGKNARCIAINSALGEFAVGYSDCFIRIFDLSDCRLKKEWRAHANSVFSVIYIPGAKLLLSGSRDARLKAWHTDNDYQLGQEVVAHLYAINHIAFSPDGKHFVTCSMDKSVKVWRTADLTLLKVIDKARHAGHGTSVNKLLWKNHLISASDDRTISVWDVIF
jgi:WD40 repeat protein